MSTIERLHPDSFSILIDATVWPQNTRPSLLCRSRGRCSDYRNYARPETESKTEINTKSGCFSVFRRRFTKFDNPGRSRPIPSDMLQRWEFTLCVIAQSQRTKSGFSATLRARRRISPPDPALVCRRGAVRPVRAGSRRDPCRDSTSPRHRRRAR